MKKKYNFELDVLEGVEVPNGNGVFNYAGIEAEGDTLAELLDGATVGVVDWHGNNNCYDMLGDLRDQELEIAEKAIVDAYNKCQEN